MAGIKAKKAVKQTKQPKAGAVGKRLKAEAEALFNPVDKNPYYFNGKPLRNLQDLADYMPAFTGNEAPWVASWIEYLGDEKLAGELRGEPGHFKEIVRERCEELKKYLG